MLLLGRWEKKGNTGVGKGKAVSEKECRKGR